MQGHVRSSTGHPEHPGQGDYQGEYQTEYLAGPGDMPRTKSRARAKRASNGKRGLAIAAGALVAVLAGGGIVFAVVSDSQGTGTSVPAQSDAPAADNGQAADGGEQGDAQSPADEAAQGGGDQADQSGGGGDQGIPSDGDVADAPSGTDISSGGGDGSSSGGGEAQTPAKNTDKNTDKTKNDPPKEQQSSPNTGEEESQYPFDGPVGYVEPRGPGGS
ncbi:hypothetical protein Misp01_36800 [Microtetraspora sp. NBRC 13810]|uniref:hypothetical protein n=1 Tax=Microtetraspora sp. NBRC 13810 TaxID=3030990 RepID=UPI0024A05521|nr:hypothetical protein [Microtetraspora sp. NBRC 13810]GLW08550.1 hypothetical protein Misp01_36800 [Microtetraspora sp. NBRC 13810]